MLGLQPTELAYYSEVVTRAHGNVCVTADVAYPEYDCHPLFCNLDADTQNSSFKCLSDEQRKSLLALSERYFYTDQNDLWVHNGAAALKFV